MTTEEAAIVQSLERRVGILEAAIVALLNPSAIQPIKVPPQSNLLPKMRTIKEAVEEIKKLDSSSRISPRYVRGLAVDGEIPCVKSGSAYLVNLDKLLGYLQEHTLEPSNQEPAQPHAPKMDSEKRPRDYGKMRRVPG